MSRFRPKFSPQNYLREKRSVHGGLQRCNLISLPSLSSSHFFSLVPSLHLNLSVRSLLAISTVLSQAFSSASLRMFLSRRSTVRLEERRRLQVSLLRSSISLFEIKTLIFHQSSSLFLVGDFWNPNFLF